MSYESETQDAELWSRRLAAPSDNTDDLMVQPGIKLRSRRLAAPSDNTNDPPVQQGIKLARNKLIQYVCVDIIRFKMDGPRHLLIQLQILYAFYKVYLFC